MKIRIPYIGAFVLLLGMSGCSETIEPKPLTYTQILTGTVKKTWLLTSFQVIDEGVESEVVPARNLFNGTCEADDQYVFYANAERKFEFTNGPTKCSASEPDVLLTDQWILTNANATLEFAFPVLSTQPLPFVIKSLTSNSMTLEIYLDQVFGDDTNASYRFNFTSSSN
ncbi:hypothetical protein GCM10027275_07950 [Rhabdobacter roseus]|uniref:Lipocalin-like domain-containing protein n=1 Tax=Rhabdobacter roseus TaxID=1655419 RepID=A0A840TIC2_9BACT|nr:hypothetical protein [Rhabdobacter roseus]MBB5282695.1 hypothetical protein [Rhabdobacter roseus]